MIRQIALILFCSVAFVVWAQEPQPERVQGSEQEIDYYNDMAYQTYREGDKLGAARYFLLYLEEPVKRGMTKEQQDSLYQEDGKIYDYAAINGIDIFYTNKDMDGVINILPYAKRVTPGIPNVYIFGVKALQSKGDSIAALGLLREGLIECQQCQELANIITEYCQSLSDRNMALQELDTLLAKAPDSPKLWYAKGVVYYNVFHDQTQARNCFSKSLAIDSSQAEVNASMGNTYIRDIMEKKDKYPLIYKNYDKELNQNEYAKELEEVQPYYFNAKQYFEAARRAAPDEISLWGEALLQCYRMLNMTADYEALYKSIPQE